MVAAVDGGTAVVAGVEVEVEEENPETGDEPVGFLRTSPRSHPAVAVSAVARWPPGRLAAAVFAAVDAPVVVVCPGSVAFLDEPTVVASRVAEMASGSFSVVHSLDSLCTLQRRRLLLHHQRQTTQQRVVWRR